MKIGPLPANGIAGINLGNVSIGAPEAPASSQPATLQDAVRRIKMKVNRSPELLETTAEAPVATDGAITDETVQAPAVTEDTKPLSPQLIALAKERRALQKERAAFAQEKALNASANQDGSQTLISRLKAQPLSVLQEHGVTYDQLTEAILADQSGTNPKIAELEAKLKSLEEGVNKNFTERDTRAEEQALVSMADEADQLANIGDEFALFKKMGAKATEKLLTRIYSHYRKAGQVLDVREEMTKIENEYLDERVEWASHPKVKSKLTPATPDTPLQIQQKPNGIRTLTNRDSASLSLGRRERAMMAAQGLLKKG